MSEIHEEIELDVPVRTAYDQWTRFEEFPEFMEGVDEVRQLTDTRLHWKARIAGMHREWDAEITRQQPDVCVSWRSVSGAENEGRVEFEPIGAERCRLRLSMRYEPESIAEKVGDRLGTVERRASRDIERFKEFIERQGARTGGTRGRVGGEGGSDVAGSAPVNESGQRPATEPVRPGNSPLRGA